MTRSPTLTSKFTAILLFCAVLLLSACATRHFQEGIYKDAQYPVSNGGMNTEYYFSEASTWPSGMAPKQRSHFVSWNHAIDLMLDKQVVSISQEKSLVVTLSLSSGTKVATISPGIDTIFEVLKQCGMQCQYIEKML